MKKLIDIKDWCIMCCVMCCALTAFNVIMVLATSERITETTIMLKSDMRELLKINRVRDARFRADYPDTEYYPDIEPMESATSWKKKL